MARHISASHTVTDTEELQKQQMFRRFKQLKKGYRPASMPLTRDTICPISLGLKKKELHPKKTQLRGESLKLFGFIAIGCKEVLPNPLAVLLPFPCAIDF